MCPKHNSEYQPRQVARHHYGHCASVVDGLADAQLVVPSRFQERAHALVPRGVLPYRASLAQILDSKHGYSPAASHGPRRLRYWCSLSCGSYDQYTSTQESVPLTLVLPRRTLPATSLLRTGLAERRSHAGVAHLESSTVGCFSCSEHTFRDNTIKAHRLPRWRPDCPYNHESSVALLESHRKPSTVPYLAFAYT